MKQQLLINIPQPCHENWDAMTQVEKGKFCNACAKQVNDFSLMTDGQILDVFKNSKSQICGRFTLDQLNRTLAPPIKPKWYTIGYLKYIISGTLLFKTTTSNAQHNSTDTTTKNVVWDTTRIFSSDVILGMTSKKAELKNIKDLIVKDEKNNVLNEVLITNENTNDTFKTNNKGAVTISNFDKTDYFKINKNGYQE